MKKRITALLLALCLALSAAPVYAGAATGQQVTANAVTVTAGNTATVTLLAENFENLAALDVYLYYDAAAFTLSGTTNGSLLSGAQTSVNTAEAGTVAFSAMSLNGMNGSGTLLTVRLSTKAATTPGTYPIKIAVGRAYDADLQPATVGSVNGSVTVNKPVETETFSLSQSVSSATLKKGDILSCRVVNSGSRPFVSGEFTVEYDHEVFAFDSMTLESALTGEGAVYSVNSSMLGKVRLAYANDTPVNNYYLFTVKLKVIADKNGTTTVQAKANNVYREDLSTYLPGSTSRSLTLQKLPEVLDHPDAFLETDALIVGKQGSSLFSLEAGAGVAAADFTLTYDPSVLRCVSVAVADGVAEKGGMVIINDNFTAGKIRFSYVNESAYSDTKLPLVTIGWEPIQSPATHYQVIAAGVGVVDTRQNPVSLEYVTDTGCIHQPTVTAPTCEEGGYTTYDCIACGDAYQMEPTEKLGHDIQNHQASRETCTEVGWDAYVTCSRCDYSTYEEISSLGHDEIPHTAKAPTCTEIGWDAYVTCSRCDYTTYKELPALGHRALVAVYPLVVETPGTTPFTNENGVYHSNNHAHSSSSECTITARYACTLDLHYTVSSETSCDRMYVFHNGTQLDIISGEVTKAKTLTLAEGDVLTIRYQKDGSVDRGDDMCTFALDVDMHNSETLAEELEPDCTNAVVCIYCDVTVKEALGHDTVSHAGKVPTCLVDGWDAYVTCSRCDYTTYVGKPALQHDEITHTAKAPTCTEIGWDAYVTCSRCDYTTYVEKPALQHDEIPHTAKVPTCTEIGWDAYVTCSRCDYTTYVEKPALQHDEISHAAKAPTCTEIGWDTYVTCSRCDYTTYVEKPALQHDEIPHTAKAPTCTEIGWNAYVTCSRCDYTTYKELPALGHRALIAVYPLVVETPGTTPFTNENGVYHSNNHAHSSSSECTITARYACTLDLHYTVSSETNCDRMYVFHNGTQLDVISGEVTKAKTLTLAEGDVLTIRYQKDGSVDRGDDMCTFALDVDMHNSETLAEELEPDCTNAVVCIYCDVTIKEALGHDTVSHAGKVPTCLAGGWDAYVTCSRCDYTTYVGKPALQHDEITHAAKAPTCTEIGWNAYVTCSRCDYSDYTEIPALGHRVKVEQSIVVDPLEVQNTGKIPFLGDSGVYISNNHEDNSSSECKVIARYGCSLKLIYATSSQVNCDSLYVFHNGILLDAISGETMHERYLSLAAGDVLTIRYVKDGSGSSGEDAGAFILEYERVGLDYVDIPAETQEPDCTNPVICAYCDVTVKEALGHDAVTHAGKVPTCLAGGWTTYETCNRCDYTTYQALDAQGHDEITHKAKTPTCTEIGWDAYVTCSRCDYTTYVEKPALQHDEISHAAKAPTCTEIGWDAYVTCSRCDYTTYVEKSALQHDEIPHAAKTPTCTEIGWDAYVTCSRCDYTTYVERPVLEHSHTVRYDGDGHWEECICGSKRNLEPHTYGAWETVKKPTTSELGLKERTCSCGYKQTEEIPVLTFAFGDVDCDGNVDTDDAVYLLLYVMFGEEGYPVAENVKLDFDGSGAVNTDDAVYLLLHVMFGAKDYPLAF